MGARRIAIIGGGISGLAAAYRLRGQGEILLYESSKRLGGVIRTDRSQGVVLEGGPDSFLNRKPEAQALCEELGLGPDLIGSNPKTRGAYIFHQGHFYDVPSGVQAGIPTRFDGLWSSGLLSTQDKLRALGDFVLPRRTRGLSDVALGKLLRYRLGDGLVDTLAAPILSGIYAGDIDKLSTRMAAPRLLSYQEHGKSLMREAERAVKQKSSPAPGGVFSTLVSGMESLIVALAERLEGVEVHLGDRVDAITPLATGGFRVMSSAGSEDVEEVIVSTPAYESSRLLDFLPEAQRRHLELIEYADLLVVGLVFKADAFSRPLNKTGFLVPKIEGLQMTAATWVRSKWHYPDASDVVPIRVFMGRAGDTTLLTKTDQELKDLVRDELAYVMGVTERPIYSALFRIPRGMPQYGVGHWDRMVALDEAVEGFPGLHLIGAYRDGVGIPDCIRLANMTTNRLLSV